MKKFFNFLTIKLLLLTLLATFAGASPAWADDTVTESFESGLPDEWSIDNSVQASASYQISISSNYSHNSTGHSLYCQYSHYSGNYCYVILPEVTGTISLYARASANKTYGYLSVYRYANGVIGTQVGTQKSKSSTSWGDDPWTFSLAENEKTQVIIRFGGLFVDDVTVTYPAEEFPKPRGLSISDITINSANITWQQGTATSWNFKYKAAAASEFTTVNGLNTNSYSLTGLNDNTTYEVDVQAVYAGGNSEFVKKEFTTLMAPITSFPWTESFNSLTNANTIPDGWDNSEGTTTNNNYKWGYNTSTSGNGATNGTGHEGKCIRFESYNNYTNNTNFLKTPVLDFSAGAPMQLVFWYKNPKGGDFSVYISDDGGETYTTALATGLTGASSWTEKKIDIPAGFIGKSNIVIVFKGTSNCGSGDAYIYLDDVTVKENATYAWSVSGSDVSENTIAFGTVKNNSTTKTFTISNDGAGTLTDVTVTSSDNTVFTVSDTNFDIAAGATKDITVTFIKEVVGDYSKTITVSQANVDDIVLTATATYETPSVAQMAIKIGENAVGETVAFGNVGKATTKTFTVENAGEADLTITSIASDNTTDFTVSPATLTVHGGQSETFTVTFVYPNESPVLDVEKTANITITPSNANLSPATFAVTGTRIEQWSEDFSENTLPIGWEAGANWSFSDGVAKAAYEYGTTTYLTTPSLTIAGTSEILTFDYKATANYVAVKVQYSKDGADFVNYSGYPTSLNNGDTGTFTITNLEAGNYKFRFANDDYQLDNFEGFKLNQNDPKMGAYTDAGCTVAAALSVTKDFGFVTEDAVQTYYIKNDGTGTLTLDQDEVPAGFSAVLGKTSLAKDESTTLTITFGQISSGYRNGNIVVNGSDGSSFTVAVSGVMVDENKLNLNFATDNIPTSWANTNFTKNSTDISCGYNIATLQTTSLTAEANEQVVVHAYQEYTSSDYTFGVNYRQVGEEDWNTLIVPQNIGTNYVTLVATIEEAGDYELQFTGRYVHIQHIYGLSEPQIPAMSVYDGESIAAATYDFGSVANTADATHTFTIKNEGNGTLAGVTATLTGDQAAHYTVEITGLTDGNIAGKSEATLTVTQKKDNLGAHAATLTISSTSDGIDDIVIALSGKTRDASKMYIEFDELSNFPEGWTAGTSWTVNTFYANHYAQQSNIVDASTLITRPLTVEENEVLSFKAGRYNASTEAELKVRYTTNGGVTWSEYTDFSSQLTYATYTTLADLELTGITAGTAVVEFYGKYVKIDDIYGFVPTTAPVLSLTESDVAVVNGSTKAFGEVTETKTATYVLSNTGNANMISTLSKTGDITFEVTTMDEGVSKSENTLTIPTGKSATIVVTMPYGAPFGSKVGALTIATEGWVADMVVNYTATAIDPTAFYINFANNTKPEGWYVSPNGYSFADGVAKNTLGSVKDLITQKLSVSDEDDILTYDAYASASWAASYASLVVSYSTDRKTWTEISEQPTLETTSNTFQIKGLAAGDYYLKFTGEYVIIDNLTGWHIVTGIDHDLYVSDTTFPTTTLIPETVNGVSASVTVNSLRANETGVYAKLFFDETVVATADAQDISKDGNKSFTLTGAVPATEKTYAAKIVVYYSDNSVAWETATTDVTVAHTRTLNITDFARVGEGEIDANANNQFSADFNVTVQNTGSTEATPVAKIYIGETLVGTATADAAVAAGESKVIAVSVINASANEGGELLFTAKAYWTSEGEALATSASNIAVTVNATAPLFALYQDATPVNDGDDVDFGLVKGEVWKTFEYSIRNEGNAPLVIKNVNVPSGFTYNDGDLQNWYLFFYKDGTYNGDVAQFKYQAENVFIARNVEVGVQGINFCVHEKDNWTNAYGWYNAGIVGIGDAVLLAGGQTSATGWLDIPAGTYDVTWNTSNNTIKFNYQGIPAGESMTIWVTLQNEQGKVSGDLTITYKVDATTDNTFTLALSGRSVSATTWTEDFAGGSIPAFWTNNGWEWHSERKAAYSGYTKGHELTTPRLKAEDGEVLTFDVIFPYSGEQLKVQYSTDMTSWNDVATFVSTASNQTFEGSFTAPAAGNYYLKFGDSNSRYVYIDNFVGFRLYPIYALNETEDNSSINDGYFEVQLTRTIKADKWNSIVLPFDVNNTELKAAFGEDVAVAEFSETATGTSSSITFTTMDTPAITANKPVLLKSSTAGTDYNFTNRTVESGEAKVEGEGLFNFVGTYAASFTVPANDYFISSNTLYKSKGTTTLKGTRAYLENLGGAIEVKMFIDDLPTSIDGLMADTEENGAVYNLAGQRVLKAQKGIFVKNGRKVVVR